MKTFEQRCNILTNSLPEVNINTDDRTFSIQQPAIEDWDYCSQALMVGLEFDLQVQADGSFNGTVSEIRNNYEYHLNHVKQLTKLNPHLDPKQLVHAWMQPFSEAWFDLTEAELENIRQLF